MGIAAPRVIHKSCWLMEQAVVGGLGDGVVGSVLDKVVNVVLLLLLLLDEEEEAVVVGCLKITYTRHMNVA